MGKSRDLFDMVFGSGLLAVGSTLSVGALSAVVWNSFLTMLNIPYLGFLFTAGIFISILVLLVGIVMLYFGAKMVNRGAGAFKGIIFGIMGALFILGAIIVGAGTGGAALPLSIPMLVGGVAFADIAMGTKVLDKVMKTIKI